MKAWSALASAAALSALAGCNSAGGGGTASNSASNAASNASDGKDAAGNSSAEATGGKDTAGATPASSGLATLDRSFLVGRWTDDGADCNKATEFAHDGRFIAANGGNGLWNLEGDQLTLTGGATVTMRLRAIDNNTMMVTNPDGSLGRSTRC